MPFAMTLGFATESDKNDFVEKILPKVRGQQVDPAGDNDGIQRVGVAVTSPSAARDLCHQIVAFLAHSKKDRVTLSWTAADGQAQTGLVTGEAARDAEILAVRVGAAAKAHLDAEKAEVGRKQDPGGGESAEDQEE